MPSIAHSNLEPPTDKILDAVIVGSGYGASVAALRFTQKHPNASVAVLEKGKEWIPGDFPTTAVEAVEEMNLTIGEKGYHVGSKKGLYDLRVFEDLVTLTGCGLGGGSLINASVMIEPNELVFTAPQWPKSIRKDFEKDPATGHRPIDTYYDRARTVLQVEVYPDNYRPLSKLNALQEGSSKVVNSTAGPSAFGTEKSWIRFQKTPVSVAFEDQTNAVGFTKPACNLCGGCISGCNTGAKGALNTTLLASAKHNGATIYTETSVNRIEQDPAQEGIWIVYYRNALDDHKTEKHVKTHRVFLGAGAMGSSEILMRSSKTLSLSPRLGTGYSGNGDSIGAAVGITEKVVTFGNESFQNNEQTPELSPGPCITSVSLIDNAKNPAGHTLTESILHTIATTPNTLTTFFTNMVEMIRTSSSRKPVTSNPSPTINSIRDIEDLLSEQMVIEDCSIPYAMKPLFTPAVKLATVISHLAGFENTITHPNKVMESLKTWILEDGHNDDLTHFQSYLVMSHDDPQKSGTMSIDESTGAFSISWPNWRTQKNYPLANKIMSQVGTQMGQDYFVPNPTIEQMDRAVSVHCLGGCCMGDDVGSGVVDDKGRVFKGNNKGGKEVWKGLYVVDGGIVPRSLGINPALTITALAERVMEFVE
ncbi:UNVERIFIED_CONTAM: hypothetical protein HDU68_001432 [Siphonaria sp. JEL0065]|nr:hypothetical protein HDU68_001432 [Siphonaria sp. JEL0065]